MMFMREDGQMGTCKICGKNFGLMGGGSEPYTGHNLQVCNSCGEVLKKIDKVKNEDTQEVKDLFVSVMSIYKYLFFPGCKHTPRSLTAAGMLPFWCRCRRCIFFNAEFSAVRI